MVLVYRTLILQASSSTLLVKNAEQELLQRKRVIHCCPPES